MRVWLLLPATLAATACGPMTLQQAERECFERARLAQQPRGTLYVGTNTDGDALASADVQISSDFLLGRDPSAIYDTCVMSKSGQAPSRPLYQRPDWKG